MLVDLCLVLLIMIGWISLQRYLRASKEKIVDIAIYLKILFE